MPNPTPSDLAQRLDRYERKVEDMEKTSTTFRHEMRKEFTVLKEWAQIEVQKFHDYVLSKQNYEAGMKDAVITSQIKSGDVVISKQAYALLAKVLGLLGLVIGAIVFLVEKTNGS